MQGESGLFACHQRKEELTEAAGAHLVGAEKGHLQRDHPRLPHAAHKLLKRLLPAR
jgi:hypothetical protein